MDEKDNDKTESLFSTAVPAADAEDPEADAEEPYNQTIIERKRCDECGSVLNEDDAFCGVCGTKVKTYARQAFVPPYPVNIPSPARYKPKKKDSTHGRQLPLPGMIAIAAACVVFLSVGLYLILSSGSNTTSSPTTEQQIEPEQPPAAPQPVPIAPEQVQDDSVDYPEPEPSDETLPADEPQTEESQTEESQMDDTILNTKDWVQLNVHWDGGESTVFMRDQNSSVWIMRSREGVYRLAEPKFSYEGETFRIDFTSPPPYFFDRDGTGRYNTGKSERHMTWSFETDTSYNMGTISGANQTADLYESVNKYPLVSIRMNHSDGNNEVYYKQDDGQWRVSSTIRGVNFRDTFIPKIEENNGTVFLYHPVKKTEYVLFDNGTGNFDSVSITWSYNFSTK